MSLLSNEILLNIRKSHKLSRKGLENLSGFKERTIMSYERGERPPSEHYITFMGLYFDVDLDYIRGITPNDKKITLFEKALLRYQNIYSYSNKQMSNLLNLSSEEFYLRVLKFDLTDIENRNIALIIETLEYLNIKPSTVGLFTPCIKYEEHDVSHLECDTTKYTQDNKDFFNERLKKLDKRITILEEKGIKLDSGYYASVIKSRNLAKENYTPATKTHKLDNKYQTILDLLPYASDSFLEDITTKLQALKDIQKL